MARIPVRHPSVCFVCESGDGTASDRLGNTFYWDADVGEVSSTVRMGPLCQGAPDHAHGGSLFALLDEAMGMAAWQQGYRVLAAHVDIDFRRPVRLGSDVEVRARVHSVDGRKVHTRGEIRIGEAVMAEASGLFVVAVGHDWTLGEGWNAKGEASPDA